MPRVLERNRLCSWGLCAGRLVVGGARDFWAVFEENIFEWGLFGLGARFARGKQVPR